VLVDKKANMTHQCALTAQEANRIPGCMKRSVASRAREGILPLYSAMKTCVQLWNTQHRMDMDIDLLEQVQRRATKMIRSMEHLPHEERLTELGLFSLEKRRLQGDPRATFQYLKGAYKKVREGLFTRGCSYRTRTNSFKPKEGRFRLDIRKKFFPMRVVRHWNQAALRSCGCPLPGSVQGQAGWGSEQNGLLEGVLPMAGGLELDDL